MAVITAPEATPRGDRTLGHSDLATTPPTEEGTRETAAASLVETRPRRSVARSPSGELEMLFREAKRRRRRRRAATALMSAALVGAAAIADGLIGGQHDPPRSGTGRPAAIGAGQHSFAIPSSAIAWEAGGTLRIGDPASLAQHAVAHTRNGDGFGLVAAGHSLYWSNFLSGRSVIQAYDFRTGAIRTVAAGWAVFPSANRREVYVTQSSAHLLILPVNRTGPARRLTVPHGWYIVPLSWATKDGVTVSSRPNRPGPGPRPMIGIWHLHSGTVQILGPGLVQATAAPPAGGGSLIAWQPWGCGFVHCPLKITNTATRATRTVDSPLRYGFLNQGGDGAFSPDGLQLAEFISLDGMGGRFAPALVNTSTGTVRVLRAARLANPELGGWMVWLSGERLLAGPSLNPRYPGYAIDARTAAVRPFTFFPRAPGTPADITYGAVRLPPTDIHPPQ